MNKNTSISLGEHFVGFIEKQIAAGRYASTSEVVRAALRMLEENETEIEALRAALIEGESSGDVAAFDIDALIAEARREFERASAGRDAAE